MKGMRFPIDIVWLSQRGCRLRSGTGVSPSLDGYVRFRKVSADRVIEFRAGAAQPLDAGETLRFSSLTGRALRYDVPVPGRVGLLGTRAHPSFRPTIKPRRCGALLCFLEKRTVFQRFGLPLAIGADAGRIFLQILQLPVIQRLGFLNTFVWTNLWRTRLTFWSLQCPGIGYFYQDRPRCRPCVQLSEMSPHFSRGSERGHGARMSRAVSAFSCLDE